MNRRNAPLRIVVARMGRRIHYRARCLACMVIALTPELFLAS